MKKDELRKLLNQPYKTKNWKKITEFIFPNVSYLQKPLEIPFKSDKVEAFKQIGTVKLSDGKNLAMFEVHVAKNFPIKKDVDKKNENRIIEQVHRIIKKKDLKETKSLEDKLDLLIFHLYNITYNEAKTIEPNLQLTEEQYNS